MDSKFVADEETAAPALAEVASPRAGASGGRHLNRDIVAALHDFELEWDVDLYLSGPDLPDWWAAAGEPKEKYDRKQGVHMTSTQRSAELAVGWIEAWIRMDLDWLRQRLAPDFVHVSPFGRFEDRESYLAAIEPMARKSVAELKVIDVISSGNQAAVWFENRTPKGAVPSCDWVRVENDTIKEIRSFYDSVLIRKVLSPADQESLDGSY